MQVDRARLASSKRFLGPLQLSKELGRGGGGAAQDRDQSALFELSVLAEGRNLRSVARTSTRPLKFFDIYPPTSDCI